MRRGYKVTLGILTIMILITITVGTSYSYYSVSATQTDYNELATTCFDISFSDKDVIKMNKDGSFAYPMSEETATATGKKPYSLTITNTCTNTNSNAPLKYDLSINTLTNPTSNLTPYIRYKLGSETSAMLSSKIDSSMSASLKTQYKIDKSYKIASGTLDPGDSITYNLYLWIDENAGNDIMANTFTGKVLVYAYM